MISLNIVPIVNTNDAVSPPMYIHDDTVVPGTGKKVSDFEPCEERKKVDIPIESVTQIMFIRR